MKRTTWTIQPADDVKSLVAKEINRRVGRRGSKKGVRTQIINEALRKVLFYLNGKREESKAA